MSKRLVKDHIVNRRDFAKRLVAGAAAVSLASAGRAAEEDAKTDDAAGSEPTVDSKPTDEVDLVLQTIVARYPDERLTEDHLKAIRGDIGYQFVLSEFLSRYPLQNSDEPAPVFAAWRASDAGAESSTSK